MHIVLAQEVLRNQFTHVDGLQLPLLSQNDVLYQYRVKVVSEGMLPVKMIIVAFFFLNICLPLIFKFITSVVITGLLPAVLGGNLLYMTADSKVI